MEETKLICGSCNINIADTEEACIERIDQQNGNWFQCFDCYSKHQESFYDYYEESYADHYCRTSCFCCSGEEHDHWDEEE